MKTFFLSATLFLFSFSVYAEILALNWKAEPEFGGFYEAQTKGLYKNMVIQEGGSGTPTSQMLMSGTVDFAIVSAEEILLSGERDPAQRLVAVMTVFETSPYMIMTHALAKAKSLEALFQDPSQTISVQKGLPYVDFLVNKFSPVKAQIVPYTGGISLFQSNPHISQQGFITSEAVLAEQQNLKVKTWLVADEGFNPYITVLAVRAETLKKKPDLVKQVVQASREGWLSYLKNPQATNKLMSQKNPSMSPSTMDLSLQKMKPLMTFEPPLLWGQMKAARWEQLQKQMIDLKLVKKTKPTHELFQLF